MSTPHYEEQAALKFLEEFDGETRDAFYYQYVYHRSLRFISYKATMAQEKSVYDVERVNQIFSFQLNKTLVSHEVLPS